MKQHNAANERIQRTYFTYLAEALGHSAASIVCSGNSSRTVDELAQCACVRRAKAYSGMSAIGT